MSRHSIFMSRQIWPWIGFLYRNRVFSRHDRVWPRHEILGRDRVFSCHDQVWCKGQESYVAI